MMKKINLKALGISSPRKEGRSSGPPSDGFASDSEVSMKTTECPIQDESHRHGSRSRDVSCPRNACRDSDVPVPRRRAKKGFLKTLRKKLSSLQRKRDTDDSECEGHSDTEERCHSLPSSLRHTPKAKQRERIAVPGHSGHGRSHHNGNANGSSNGSSSSNDDPRLRHSLPRLHANGESYTPRRREFVAEPLPISQHSRKGASKSETESEKEDSPGSEHEKELFPSNTVTAYGHASAPVSVSVNGSSTEQTIPNSYQGTPVRAARMERLHNGAAGGSSSSTNTDQEVYEMYDNGTERHIVPALTVIPFYDQVRDLPKSWNLSHELFKLSKFGWYWGPITRVEAEEKLANQTDGCFLVRDSSDERYLLSLSFRSYNRTLHTRIEHCNGVFSFYAQPESEGYTSIVDLIEHSMSDSRTGVFCYSRARTPGAISFPVRLTKPVSRFSQVRSLQYLCRFIIRQYTRLDHIQSLPLPTSIKGWLEENQY